MKRSYSDVRRTCRFAAKSIVILYYTKNTQDAEENIVYIKKKKNTFNDFFSVKNYLLTTKYKIKIWDYDDKKFELTTQTVVSSTS